MTTPARTSPAATGPDAAPESILRPRTEAYQADLLTPLQSAVAIVIAAIGGAAATLAAWKILKLTSLPAFSTSMVTRALATAAVVFLLIVLGVLVFMWVKDGYRGAKPRPAWRHWLTYVVAYLSPAGLTVATLGIPLSATRLWLDGIQVDQVFRTQFLTRATETAMNADMNYADMPTYYPLGWFWLGGRLANFLGIPGWEVYQPWALMSLAMFGCALVPLWQRLTGSLPVAAGIALTTTAITLALGAEEPYSAVISMGVPAICVLGSRAFRGSWWAMAGIAIYLGISASYYTLFTGVVAISIVVFVGVIVAVVDRSWRPIMGVAVIGFASLAIASITWGPYVLAALRADVPLESAAQHYLPLEGTQIPVPFLAFSMVGLFCFIGLVYLIMRFDDPDIRVMTIGLAGIYMWAVASMVVSLAGTTLLGFRLEVLIVTFLCTAGILAVAEMRLLGVPSLYPSRFSARTNQRITAAFIVVTLLGAVHYAQQIPSINESAIDHAYSDTDGYGERADRYAGDSSTYYPDIHQYLEDNGHPANDTVVMTDEKLFMAYYPYYGFNAFTAHYANPLGQFSVRNGQMETWAAESWDESPQDFVDNLNSSPWHAPDVMIFRGSLEEPGDGFKIHLAEDIYPNQPNVRYRSVFFNPEIFADESLWSTEQFGPFVVVARNQG